MTYDVIQNGAENPDVQRKSQKKSPLKPQDAQDYELYFANTINKVA